MEQHILVLLSYSLLYLTVISLWIPKRTGIQIWHVLLIASILFGLFSQQIKPISIIPIVLLPLAIIYELKKTISFGIRVVLFILVLLLCVGLGAHLFPGFYNLKVLNQVYISKNAIPFTMYLNFDKALIGIFILGLSHQLITSKKDWVNLFKHTIPLMTSIIFIVIIFAILLGFIRFDPKLPNNLPIWIITNLLFVSAAEEAFFRGFLQKNLSQAMKKINYGNYIAILCVSILFGIVHYAGGIKYILLATISGLGYGFVYDRTKHIESSIITHFSLNLTHFLLFTYPMLASAL